MTPHRQRKTATALAAIALLLTLDAPARARTGIEVEGVTFAPSLSHGGQHLILNNAGLLRYRLVIKAYVAALYLGEGVAPAAALDDVPKRLEAEYFWALSGGDFGPATREGMRRNVDAATLAALEPRLERFAALFVDVRPGDRYALTYLPGVGTELALNGRALGTIPGADFAAALFAIWLGPDPLDGDLKRSLLASR
ncbi:MAG: chalcone isomerase family protein [Candidatus Binatia bacterium]